MQAQHENRKYERFLISQHIDCRVRLSHAPAVLLLLSDISEGGMMLLYSGEADAKSFTAELSVNGEILSDNTAVCMQFEGRIVWTRQFTESGKSFTSMGIAFAPTVSLPEAIRAMLLADTDD